MTEQTKDQTVSNPVEAVVSAADLDILQEMYQSLERKGIEIQKTDKTKARKKNGN